MSDFLKRISMAQNDLKAPKSQYNSFGKYNYRSCEDILEAAKPICRRHNIMLKLSDKVVQVGDRHYIEATATLYDIDSDAYIESTASAREADSKKGMDESQVTGTASSYARKYALNGLFNIDDTKDADTDEHKKITSYFCSECGVEIKQAKKSDGTIVSPKEIYDSCNGMCVNCYRKKQKENNNE